MTDVIMINAMEKNKGERDQELKDLVGEEKNRA